MKTSIKITNQSTPTVVFVKGAQNKLAHAIFNGYVRPTWSTAGHRNMYTKVGA